MPDMAPPAKEIALATTRPSRRGEVGEVRVFERRGRVLGEARRVGQIAAFGQERLTVDEFEQLAEGLALGVDSVQ